MLIIPIKDGENIDRALKRFKRKFKVPLNAFLWDFSLVYFIS